MRITRHKAFKKALRFFKAAFDLVDPYHVILDPSFIDSSVCGKINPKEDLSKLLSGRVTPMVTECIMCHLRKNGRSKTEALLFGKTCYRLKCGHDGKNPLSPTDCVLSQLNKENPRHFLVATQEDDLKARARIIPGTPVLSIHGTLLMLESPSNESRRAAEHREMKRKLPKLSELAESDGESSDSETDDVDKTKTRKKRGKRAPNPLSCKRKQQKPPTAPIVNDSTNIKKKRIRSKRTLQTPSVVLV